MARLLYRVYNHLERVNNGLVIGLRHAGKKMDGEHFYWEGGETVLLDTAGNLLIAPFSPSAEINLYSVEISDQPINRPDRLNYKAVDGRYHSFIDYEKEFSNWLKNIVGSLHPDLLKEHVFEQVSYYVEDEGWVFRNGETFVHKNYPVLEAALQQLTQPSCDSFITCNGLNPFIYETSLYEKYFDNCNQAMVWKYPQMSIIINHYKGGEMDYQESFDFLRTDEGYKLISVNIKSVPLK